MHQPPSFSDTPADIFLHIPKTAGDTLMTILWRQYRFSGGYLEAPDPHRVDEPYVSLDSSFEGVRRLALERSEQYRLFYGHMPFGVHEAIPRPARYFTMLRDPLERAISHYYYVKREPKHRLHGEVVERRMTLHDYIVSGVAPEISNGQTALLAGFELGVPSDDTAALHKAKANLEERFVVAGLTEDFDRSIVLFRVVLGWDQPIFYESKNVTTNRPHASSISPETIDEIRTRNQLDDALYRFVRDRFQAQVEKSNVAVKQGLRQLKVGNVLYRRGPKEALRRGWKLARRMRNTARR